jgi:hypothetical protein
MPNQPCSASPLWRRFVLLAVACPALAACGTSAHVSATANVPARYVHVWLTVNQVWLHASAAAAPDDAGWSKFTLSTPATLDLVQLTDGALLQFTSALNVPTGTYGQLRILLTDPSAALLTSAQSAGALFNDEVDFFDSTGIEQKLPLRLVNPEKGIGIAMTLKVPDATTQVLASLGAGRSASTASSSLTTMTTSPTTSLATTSTTPTSTTTSASIVPGAAAIDFDGARDLVPFIFSGQLGFLLNPHLTGYDLAAAGTIQGQLNIASLSANASTRRPDVEVSAEILSTDRTRHVIVKSAPVRSDGTFVLYPLSTASGAPTSYDLVIHGPLLETVIVKSVPVGAGTPSSAATIALGTLTLAPATSFTVNVASASPVSPRGARIGFYQTLPQSGETPYLIEERPIDPFSGLHAEDQSLSAADIAFGTFASGQTMALTTVTPAEGSATYKVTASTALFSDGVFGATVAAPASGATPATTFTVAAPLIPTTATAATIVATLNIASPGKYDKGGLLVTHNGTIIALASLDGGLAQPQVSATLNAVPGGAAGQPFDSGLYYADAWVWNSNDPIATLTRQGSSAAIDLRSGSSGSVALTIN